MPLPLGHTVIGITTHEVFNKKHSAFSSWKVAVYITILANLPDMDVLAGLLLQGNGFFFHRGPTHSLFFALVVGFIASVAHKLWLQIPKISFRSSFLIVLSHFLADFFFTNSSISLFWPFEVTSLSGYIGWLDIINYIFQQSFQDARIIFCCVIILIVNRLVIRNPYNTKKKAS